MTEKKHIIKEFEQEFTKLKKNLGFKADFETLDKEFFLSDAILDKGFVSKNLSSQIRGRIVEVIISMDNYLHSLIMPNPQNLFNINESKALNDNDKKEVTKIMSRAAYFVAKNAGLRFADDKKEEGKFIDEVSNFWHNKYKPFMKKILEKIEERWKESDEKVKEK
ncbi:MAG: hypothetical protein QW727_00425 [Candidatus Pacearchaeota archaeon]